MKLFIFILMISQLAFAAEKFRFIGDVNLPTGEKFKETEIGGLSGITYDAKNNRLISVSDDRSSINPARFYIFDFNIDEKNFSIKPFDVVTVKDSNNKPFAKHSVDFEGITLVGSTIYISSEGSINRDNPINPTIFKFSLEGKELGQLPIPPKFLPTKESFNQKTGPRDNLSFEALTSTPDGKVIFAGMEEALLQDDSVTTPTHQSILRILKFVDEKPVKEFAYQLELVPSIAVAGLTVGETGMPDMAAIDENSSYTLERAFMPLAKKTSIKIFKISNIDKATDVSSIDSLKGNKNFKTVDKELVLDLDTVLNSFSDKFRSTDNIESICFGPKLKNGHQTIIVVSDNNFSKTQRTQFLAFEIIP